MLFIIGKKKKKKKKKKEKKKKKNLISHLAEKMAKISSKFHPTFNIREIRTDGTP
jgi:hypothetical protein